MKRIIAAIFSLAAIAGCSVRTSTEDVMSDSTPRLIISGSAAFIFDECNCQESFNATRHEYCAMTDNASDFFALKLKSRPSETNETLTGDLRWTTETSTREMKNVTFKVLKLEGDTFWLDASNGRLKVVGRILE